MRERRDARTTRSMRDDSPALRDGSPAMRDSSPEADPPTMYPVRVEVANSEDLAPILAFVQGAAEMPQWSRPAWEAFLQPQPEAGLRRILFLGRRLDGAGRRLDGAGRRMDGAGRRLDGAIVGILAANLLGASAELELLLVDPQERRQGTGRRLLEDWIGWAKGEHAGEARLEVRAANTAALSLYTARGFIEEGRRKGYYRHPVDDAVTMRLVL